MYIIVTKFHYPRRLDNDKANRKKTMYNEQKIRKSEALQLHLMDNLYAQSGSHNIIFQGGMALRWVYGGLRFSEDLDFSLIFQ